MKKIAFFGLGNMGLPMAVNLAEAFDGVCGFDVVADARRKAAAAGLQVADAAADIVPDADAVVTMLPAGRHVRELLAGDDGLFQQAGKNTLFIDCSTTAPEDAREFAAAAAAASVCFIDAPVSGGIGAAKAGTLSFLVGGNDTLFESAKPLLSPMGGNVFHAGPAGSGQAAKLCNNMMLSIQMIGACEALALGEKMGLDAGILSEIMKKSSGGNWVVEKYNPMPGVMDKVPAANNYQGGFAVDLMVKDSNLAMRAGAAHGALLPLGALANQLFRLHQNSSDADGGDNGKLDFGSILTVFREAQKRGVD